MGLSVKPSMLKLDWWTRRIRPVFGRDRIFIVGEPGSVGGAHLTQVRAGLGENLRNPEAAADFDQLSARNDDFGALGQRIEREESSRRTVIHHDRSSETSAESSSIVPALC